MPYDVRCIFDAKNDFILFNVKINVFNFDLETAFRTVSFSKIIRVELGASLFNITLDLDLLQLPSPTYITV